LASRGVCRRRPLLDGPCPGDRFRRRAELLGGLFFGNQKHVRTLDFFALPITSVRHIGNLLGDRRSLAGAQMSSNDVL
jgi:hypothetical protein